MNINNKLVLGTVDLPDFPASAPIGTASATVDRFSSILINQTTVAVILTIPAPTVNEKGQFLQVGNIGTVDVTVEGYLIPAGKSARFEWSGASWLPEVSASASSSVPDPIIKQFSANGTYTPTPGTKYAIVRVQGAGGGSGGSSATGGGGVAVGGAGGGGGFVEVLLTAAQLGASQPVVIGAAGAAGAAAAAGGAGGASSFGGTIAVGNGGLGGGTVAQNTSVALAAGGQGGNASNSIAGTLVSFMRGGAGDNSIAQVIAPGQFLYNCGRSGISHYGGSQFSFAGYVIGTTGGNTGVGGTVVGVGGSGSFSINGNPAENGAPGGPGFVSITEYFG